jgi:hypothetical protein
MTRFGFSGSTSTGKRHSFHATMNGMRVEKARHTFIEAALPLFKDVSICQDLHNSQRDHDHGKGMTMEEAKT